MYLIRGQITVTGNVSVSSCGSDATIIKQSNLIGSLSSPSIVEMLNWTLQTSDNLYAETFLRHLGKTVSFIFLLF